MLNRKVNNRPEGENILCSNILGEKNEKHIIILHGLYGCADSWKNIGEYLSAGFCVHLLDMRNHGNSFHNDSHTYEDMVQDLLEYSHFHKLSRFSIIGHSMGGKTAMFFADKYPELTDKIIVTDISPRNYKSLTENEPIVNFHLNLISVMKNMNISSLASYSEIEALLTSQDKNIKNLILKNLKKKDGKFSWRININSLSNNLGNILSGMDPDDYIENKIHIKTLFIKTSDSNYINNNDKKLINFIFLNSEIIEIPDAGHWIHIEQPELLKMEISKFLNADDKKLQ